MAKIQEWLDMGKKQSKTQTLSKIQKQQMTKEDPRTEIAGNCENTLRELSSMHLQDFCQR